MKQMFGEIWKSRGARVAIYLRAVLFCAALVSPKFLFAQNYNGSINGTVTDPSGAAVPGATVSVFYPGTNASYTATTSDLGRIFRAEFADRQVTKYASRRQFQRIRRQECGGAHFQRD